MANRSTRGRATSERRIGPGFPQPVQSFAGRRLELDRVAAHVDEDVLFLIYGVAGIGKTELVYRAIREAQARPRWADAIPVLLEVQAGMTTSRALAQLIAALGATPVSRRGRASERAFLAAQLSQLVRLLDTRPYLLVIDDVHHLPEQPVAAALAYLARHVRRSRLFVVSRRELALPPEAPPPVVTMLGPLDLLAAEQMVIALAERLQLAPPDPEAMMRATHGSPFHIRALLGGVTDPDTGSLASSLDELGPVARRVLRAASIARSRPTIDTLRRAWREETSLDEVVRTLEQRFLLEVKHGQLIVHDLVREAWLGRADREELAVAHADAAGLCLAALGEPDPSAGLVAVDAANHLVAAGRFAQAWSVIDRWLTALTAAGNDHLLLEPLERLRSELPAGRVAIELLIARCLVRASRFDDAARVLACVGEARTAAEDARYCVLAGEIAQQAGELVRAAELFARAVVRAPDEHGRFGAQLRQTTTASLLGDGGRARELLEVALGGLTTATPGQHARASWVRTVSWMFDERFEQAIAEARRARRELADTGLGDLANQLAMLEMLACIECDDMDGARAAARAIDEAGLRRRVASLYRAIIRYADGEARDASIELVAAHDDMRARGDTINAYLAGYYGSAALAEVGELGKAQGLAERTAQLAQLAGLHALAARSLAQQALFAAEAVQSGAAHRLAGQALASERIGCRSRARAHCAHVHAFTIEGDIARALEHVALAREAMADAELAAARSAIDIEHAAVELVGGNLERAVDEAERVVVHLRGRSRAFETARAELVLAAAYVARGRRTDLLFAEQSIAHARQRADVGQLRSIQVGCAILSAALARRENRDRAARELLADALRELDPERGSLYAGTLLAAIDSDIAAHAAPGAVALLAHLGFCETVDCYLVDRQGRRAATSRSVARERERRELFVDEVRAVIVGCRGDVEISGKPMLCALISVLVQARGKPVSPDTLYKRVWGVAEYHPLHHRNALYVAINRLRSCLREALPGRDVIERASDGWRLADGIDACVAVAVRPPEQTM